MHLTTLALLISCSPSSELDSSSPDSPSDVPDSPPQALPEALYQVSVQCPGNILDEPKAPCVMAIEDSAGTSLYAGPAGLELRGRSSLRYPKPQYSVELRDFNDLPVWPGAVWSYLDRGQSPGSGWTEPSYDDSAWSTGGAPLGFGVGYLTTAVAPNPAGGSVTTWFRRVVTLESVEHVTRVRLGLIRQDGAAVYLNGFEILRDNLAVGANASTLAASTSTPEESIEWVEVSVPPGLLHLGANTLAVEVHQADASIDQLRFDVYFEVMGDESSVNFGDMGANADWILNGLYADRVLWRNRLAYDVFQSFGGKSRYATESRFCELEINGDYQGLYSLGERIARDDDRIDIAEAATPGETFIIKLDDQYGFHPNVVGIGTWQMVYPEDDAEAAAAVSEVLGDWEDAVRGPNAGDPDIGVFKYLDLDSAVDFVLLQEFMLNNDGYDLSVHLWRGSEGKMHFTPWDFDLSMGYPNGDCGADGWLFRPEYIAAMVAVPAFKEALVTRWGELRTGQLSSNVLLGRIADLDEVLEPGLARNLVRWPVDEISVTTVGAPQELCPVGSYDEEHARVLAYIAARLAWMDANIASF